ncbi:hypothetical protein ONS95_002974 [Cadophora gregata]|uniref:uncharacterized protein n=1 Tax=Cadophora gregata TaxID=51156 RepID=UPI0026DCC180|nr:uncharacterized protein ONS95_002974 [Cadophora gregata]KAK0108152.1 hypothetical protein ONS95_002974 [Cadophora gregata]KAK0109253.1 hypothetical protein ONS96_003075 [Cadophora gregata f. sp. sojae]
MYLLKALILMAAIAPIASTSSIWRRADAVVPVSPRAGDTIVTNTNWDILWTSNGDRNVTITLQQGEAQNLTLAHIITASTPNNGSYSWRARDDTYLRALFRSNAPTSGCNYTIEFRTNGQAFYSGFFSIFNEQDGGLTANMSCDTSIQPGKSSGSGSGSGSAAKASSGGGYSTGALAGGIAGAAIGMALLLGALFFLALKKDWIVTGKECRRRVEQRGMAAEAGQFLPKKEDHEPHVAQIGGEPVYQMP